MPSSFNSLAHIGYFNWHEWTMFWSVVHYGSQLMSVLASKMTAKCRCTVLQCACYNVYATMCMLQCACYNVHATMCMLQCACICCNVHATMCMLQCACYNAHATMCMLQCACYNVHAYAAMCMLQCACYNVHAYAAMCMLQCACICCNVHAAMCMLQYNVHATMCMLQCACVLSVKRHFTCCQNETTGQFYTVCKCMAMLCMCSELLVLQCVLNV